MNIKIPNYIKTESDDVRPIIIDGNETDYLINRNGDVISLVGKTPKKLDGHITANGYRIYCLKVNGEDKWMLGHRLTAMAFIPIPENLAQYDINKLEVNHIKGDSSGKLDNSVSNLEWVTSSGNKYHAYKTGLMKNAENSPVAKYTDLQIHKVCRLLEENRLSRMQIALVSGVDDATIGMILSGEQWTTISCEYDFSKRKKKHTLYDPCVIDAVKDMIKESLDKGIVPNFSKIGREVGMSRTSVWYLYDKHFRNYPTICSTTKEI